MMKVLLATDGSDQATTAFRTASRLLLHEDNEFDPLCVAPEFYCVRMKRLPEDRMLDRMVADNTVTETVIDRVAARPPHKRPGRDDLSGPTSKLRSPPECQSMRRSLC